ncbi:hypothetical protein BT63DRAFT_468996 [Microthyrium microscopicum]|uniref:Uncharacterized protein n=1 Tax=Microthyrium microscopicum TaxID=703497 RepID=A0A6A6UFV0_9PEZI|nr:hypothetical protein BT63DRAFT_468996 [Microthyrium microscopicum]
MFPVKPSWEFGTKDSWFRAEDEEERKLNVYFSNQAVEAASSSPEPQVIHYRKHPVTPECFLAKFAKKKKDSFSFHKFALKRSHKVGPATIEDCNEADGPVIDESAREPRSRFEWEVRSNENFLTVFAALGSVFAQEMDNGIEFPKSGKAIYGTAYASNGDLSIVLKVSPAARFQAGEVWEENGYFGSALFKTLVTNEHVRLIINHEDLEHMVLIDRKTGHSLLPADLPNGENSMISNPAEESGEYKHYVVKETTDKPEMRMRWQPKWP